MKLRCLVLCFFLLGSGAAGVGTARQSRQSLEADHRTQTQLFVPKPKAADVSSAVMIFMPRSSAFGHQDWDLGYGFLAISDQDWFEVSHAPWNRSVMRDLGKLNWFDQFKVPILVPLPELAKGERRNITVDSSADTHSAWAATTEIFAKVVVGHMYAIHVKDDEADYYALFRVEDHIQRDHCTISWKVIDSLETR